ncbi:MAG: hypothetical protein MK212_19390 [Saprospiraceae bacterium]|nr:hypothetical protein [Saprospiraceae bacterium]
MKRLLLIVSILSGFVGVTQDTQGMQGKFEKEEIPVHARRQMYGINGFFDSDKITINGNDFKSMDYGFDLLAGYFVADKLVVGGKLGWHVNEGIFTSDEFLGEKILYGGIYSRYYVMMGDSYFALFPEVTVGYAGITIDTENGHGPLVQAGGGITHFLSPNVGLEFVGFYEYMSVSNGLDLTFNNFGMRLGFQVYLPYESKPDLRDYY